MAGDNICCASYVENGENMMEKDESNVSSDLEDEAKENPDFVICPEFEFSVSFCTIMFSIASRHLMLFDLQTC